MCARAERAQDVATVELRGGKQIERSGEQADPRGASYRVQQKTADRNAGMKQRGENSKDQRRAKNDAGVSRIAEARDEFCMEDPVDERRDGNHETHERARCADVEQCPSRSNGRADQNEGAERTDERGEWDEKWIARMNVMVATCEVVAEFVSEQNRQESQREGQPAGEREGLAIEKRQRANELVPGHGLILRIGGGEVGPGHQARAER